MKSEHLYLNNCSPEELTSVIDSTQMLLRFLPDGLPYMAVDRVFLEHAVVQRGRHGMGVVASGSWPAGHVCLGMVQQTPSHATVNGFLCPTMSIQLYGEGVEVNYRAPPDSTWFAYCVEREVLQGCVTTLFGEPLCVPQSGTVSITPTPQSQQRLANCLDQLFTVAALAPSKQRSESIRALEQQLLYEAAYAVTPPERHPGATTLRHAAKRRRLMTLAEDYLRANLSGTFVLGECAQATGCSERMLERHFRAIYGVPPGTWFRCMKLDAIRRDLYHASAGKVRVSDVAAHWGISHFGRFSVQYRQLFGESPRDTLLG